MEKKYLYLKANKNAVFYRYIKNHNIQNYYILTQNNIIFRLFRKFGLLNSMLFGLWKFKIKNYQYIILGENCYSPKVVNYIKKKNPNCKIIMYYWNLLNDEYKKILKDKQIDEFWTFDRNEALKYNLKYNPQFYTKDLKLKTNKVEQDIIFLGRAKERKKDLLELQERFKNIGITSKYNIIETEKDLISYDEYLNLISKSKCILDYNQDGQVGLTLRPMEALFLKKKLITNNKDIVNYDFYNPSNIFVLGIDDMNKIKEFIENPYEDIDENIVNYYDYEQWLARFGI